MKRRLKKGDEESRPLGGAAGVPDATRSDVTPFIEACRATPDVDSEKVRRARMLLENGGYPSEEVLRLVARQLARNWPAAAPSGPEREA
ncbi:MAG: hypothetical protein HYR88_03855 [Verrucomicrobia bacterium]|nr:hypothetical protein [Verrucomicrobiota bacterium]MBI3868755.1 hypothetical protein [Verrucomicrobiota bacterium]